ncbi:MAG: ATP-binding cassette domain-containing protein [Verrucomicrobiota bacterium]|nr:ATP-binding cassette domain-containing protein [Verrucomicrobiota bacterium]
MERRGSGLAARAVCCTRQLGAATSRLENLSADFAPATMNLLWGEPGCGKNLLLRLFGQLEAPDAGDILVGELSTRDLDVAARAALRNERFGFVFSAPFLLPSFSVIENIAMPLFKISAATIEEARSKTRGLLDFVGLRDCDWVPVDQLSLLDQQRVSLARALANWPEFLLVEDIDAHLRGPDLDQFTGLLGLAAVELKTLVICTGATDLVAGGAHSIEMRAGTFVDKRS